MGGAVSLRRWPHRGRSTRMPWGLEVAAGHGLTQENVRALIAIPEIVELNIGHAVVSDAVFVGMREAVRGYRTAIARPPSPALPPRSG